MSSTSVRRREFLSIGCGDEANTHFLLPSADFCREIASDLMLLSNDYPAAQRKLGTQIRIIARRTSLPHVPKRIIDFWTEVYREYIAKLVVKGWSPESDITEMSYFCAAPGCVNTDSPELMCGGCESVQYCSPTCQKS